jgi:hypothetical protein
LLGKVCHLVVDVHYGHGLDCLVVSYAQASILSTSYQFT